MNISFFIFFKKEINFYKSGISLEDQIIFSRKTGRRSFGNFNPQIEVFFKKKYKEIFIY